jgi:DNA repair ATPase RecN
LRGNFFGLKINDDEKLNTKKLTKEYNNKIQENINEMAKLINNSCISSFNSWRKRLESVIEQNITEYNPNLRGMSELIREETEKIAELEQNQRTIQDSLDTIRTLMSWKTIE